MMVNPVNTSHPRNKDSHCIDFVCSLTYCTTLLIIFLCVGNLVSRFITLRSLDNVSELRQSQLAATVPDLPELTKDWRMFPPLVDQVVHPHAR